VKAKARRHGPHAAGAGDFQQLIGRRVAGSKLVIAPKLRLAQVNSAMPRHNN
jgi:hypothetical protein